MSDKKYQLERSRKGMCRNCGKRPSRPGRVWCQRCQDAHGRHELDISRLRRTLGLCPRCGKVPPPGGRKICLGCLGKIYAARDRRKIPRGGLMEGVG